MVLFVDGTARIDLPKYVFTLWQNGARCELFSSELSFLYLFTRKSFKVETVLGFSNHISLSTAGRLSKIYVFALIFLRIQSNRQLRTLSILLQYRRAQPFNLPAQPFNLSISDKLWTLEKNKGHFIILELNSGIIKWPLFFSKVYSLSDIDRLKGCALR